MANTLIARSGLTGKLQQNLIESVGISGVVYQKLESDTGITGSDIRPSSYAGVLGDNPVRKTVPTGITGLGHISTDTGIIGLGNAKSQAIFGIKSFANNLINTETGISGKPHISEFAGILGFEPVKAYAGIKSLPVAAKYDFGKTYSLLSDKVSLRESSEWGNFSVSEPVPVVYGQTIIKPIPYDKQGKVFVLADHPIKSVLNVWINNENIKNAWVFKNDLDSTGKPVSFLTMNFQVNESDIFQAEVEGKLKSTGELISYASEVVYDIYTNILGQDLDWEKLNTFDITCKSNNLKISGAVTDNTMTYRALISEVLASVGCCWSPLYKNFAVMFPV